MELVELYVVSVLLKSHNDPKSIAEAIATLTDRHIALEPKQVFEMLLTNGASQ